ncbi:MAG TPA: DUF1801 domain-containing protein [Gemmatimonadaceae bacterium]|nr:DUF1801 domain-containing protein [Gemmatimonadaceae bacterium]
MAGALRDLILSVIPNAAETLDQSGRVVGYGIGAGYTGMVCTIIPSKTGVKLGIVGGADLPNPQRLLEGTGKRHRYVQFNALSDIDPLGLRELIATARNAAESKVAKRT